MEGRYTSPRLSSDVWDYYFFLLLLYSISKQVIYQNSCIRKCRICETRNETHLRPPYGCQVGYLVTTKLEAENKERKNENSWSLALVTKLCED